MADFVSQALFIKSSFQYCLYRLHIVDRLKNDPLFTQKDESFFLLKFEQPVLYK